MRRLKLNVKRKRVLVTILGAIIINTLVMAALLLHVGDIKNVFLAFAKVVMFIIIWDIYFDEQLARKSPKSLLQDLLAITCISLITAFIIAQGISKVVDTFLNTVGSFSWLFGGMTAGVATGILGLMWALYCDDYYRNSASK